MLDEYLKEKGINIRGAKRDVHIDVLRDFFPRVGIPSSLSMNAIASCLGGICESHTDNYVNIDPVVFDHFTTLDLSRNQR